MCNSSASRPKRVRALKGWAVFIVGLALLTMPAIELKAQSLFATVTGVVSDPSGAVVPGATLVGTSGFGDAVIRHMTE